LPPSCVEKIGYGWACSPKKIPRSGLSSMPESPTKKLLRKASRCEKAISPKERKLQVKKSPPKIVVRNPTS
jgi:hypothetical protein